MSPSGIFFPPLSTSKLGQNSILQQEVWPDRWKRWEYVLLINETRQEGKGEGGGTLAVGVGETM